MQQGTVAPQEAWRPAKEHRNNTFQAEKGAAEVTTTTDHVLSEQYCAVAGCRQASAISERLREIQVIESNSQVQ